MSYQQDSKDEKLSFDSLLILSPKKRKQSGPNRIQSLKKQNASKVSLVKNQSESVRKVVSQSKPTFQMTLRQKFQDIYRKTRITKGGLEIRIVKPVDNPLNKNFLFKKQPIYDSLIRIKSSANPQQITLDDIFSMKKNEEDQLFKINTVAQINMKRAQFFVNPFLRRTRYRQNLKPIHKSRDITLIKDSLSVGKMEIKQTQRANVNSYKSRDLEVELLKNDITLIGKKRGQGLKNIKLQSIKKSKFKIPFELYHYRDFIWKAGYSNNLIVQIPKQYPYKVKYYIGKGNNSRLIRSILQRRTWLQPTDRLNQANFIWTQLKIQSCFIKQESSNYSICYQTAQYLESSILNGKEFKDYQSYKIKNISYQNNMKQNMQQRNKHFRIKPIKLQTLEKKIIHNHLKYNFLIGNKKALLYTMRTFYSSRNINVFDYLPITFHIKNSLQDQQYTSFLRSYNKHSKLDNCMNIWIVKPGQSTNRGKGIIVCKTLQQIKNILKSEAKHQDGDLKTFIVQKYIERPMLYKKRKFDLRHYLMISCINGIVKGYWYKQGYVRTTSKQYNLQNSWNGIHLTNDAIQKFLPDYGKYEKGNKITYDELDCYLKRKNQQLSFWSQIYPKMKKIGIDILQASACLLDPHKKQSNFEIFGLDFMIDQDFNVWLIQANTNPCLQLSCPLLAKLIPNMLENALELTIDVIYPAPQGFKPRNSSFYKNRTDENMFELVYDERGHPQSIKQLPLMYDKNFQEDQEQFDDQGEEFTQQVI